MMRKIIFCAVLSVSALMLAGCGSGSEVTGTVRFEGGEPLPVGTVRFESGAESFSGPIDSSGQYRLAGATAKDGVPNGEYRVSIVGATSMKTDKNGYPAPQDLIDRKFFSGETSGLKCTVTGSTAYDIEVSSP